MITAAELDDALVDALPELRADRSPYAAQKLRNPENQQTFFGYSFVPTLQGALDQQIDDFALRAFAFVERLLVEGDAEVQAILKDEFLEYGPLCEKWMKKAERYLGPETRRRISSIEQ